jgi:DNA (cytosine-5)-methyltransferase 1
MTTPTLYGRFDQMVDAVLSPPRDHGSGPLKFIDLFCGIGGFHVAGTSLGLKGVFACDIDEAARKAYKENFGLDPMGDITAIRSEDIPDHDLLFAGFPCQPFSIIGSQGALNDPDGTLYLEIVRILKDRKPKGFVLENVKQLSTTQGGAVLRRILDDLRGAGYTVDHRVLNALDFGLPQKRERTLIVGTLEKFDKFPWPDKPIEMKPLSDILEASPDARHLVSDTIREKRVAAHQSGIKPAIWHENKAGNVSSHPWSCALRAGASYNYLLVDGERRLTPREMLRLQGFPDSFKIVGTDSRIRKQAGNAVPVPVVEAVIKGVLNVVQRSAAKRERSAS